MSQGRLAGKIAIITGSTYGIGFATARRFAQEGAKVIVSSRNPENVQKATETLQKEGFTEVVGVPCHVANIEDRLKLLEKAKNIWGGLDILVMNAAVNPSIEPILECSESKWDKIQNVNVKSALMMTKEAAPLLEQSKAGRVIYTSTIAIFLNLENIGAYSVSKLAIVGLMKMVSKELAKKNITVNCITPGLISTDFSRVLIDDEENRNALLKAIDLKRFGTPEEVAHATLFLASEEASYITGENLCVGGGMLTRI